MAEALRGESPGVPVTLGLHQEDLEENRRMGPRETAVSLAFACMHGYPAYARWSRDPVDDGVPVFLGLLTRWLSGQRVLFAEFGTPTRRPDLGDVEVPGLLGEEEAARYTERVLGALHRLGFLGALLWCFGDYDLALRNEPPFDQALHEMSFGLWRSDRSPKPALNAVKAFGPRERMEHGLDLDWIDVTQDEYLSDPPQHLGRLFEAFAAGWPGR